MSADEIVRSPDVLGGEPRIAGRRVSVRQVQAMIEERGLSPREVADRLDLTLADAESAVDYYRAHPREMERVRRRRREIVEAHSEEAITGPADLRRSADT